MIGHVYTLRRTINLLDTIIISLNSLTGSLTNVLILLTGSTLTLNGDMAAGTVLTMIFLANLASSVSFNNLRNFAEISLGSFTNVHGVRKSYASYGRHGTSF